MNPARARKILAPAVSLVALTSLTACSSSEPQAAPTTTVTVSATSSRGPSAAPSTAAPGMAAPGTSAPSTAAPTPTPSPALSGDAPSTAPPSASGPAPRSSQSGPQPCRTEDLTITQGGGSGGAAGSVYTAVRFVNKGSAACTLNGHPGVSFVGGADGHQVGAAADRGSEEPVGRVLLQPGGQAHATLRITQQGLYTDSDCGPEPARGLRVYPPDQTASAFVPFAAGDQVACSKTSVSLLTVEPVAPGPPSR